MLVSVQTSFESQYIAHLEMSRLPLRGKGRVSRVHVNHGDWVVLSVTLNSTDFINFLSASFTPKRGVLSHLLVFPAMPDIFFVFSSVCFVVSPQSPVFLKSCVSRACRFSVTVGCYRVVHLVNSYFL